MNKRSYQNKWDREVMVCIGTDLPPLSTIEWMIYERILEIIEQTNTNILTMNDIFEGYTHTKRARFELVSRLVKKKMIFRKKIDSNHHQYEKIPEMNFRDSKEMRVYHPKTRRERLALIREFIMNK